MENLDLFALFLERVREAARQGAADAIAAAEPDKPQVSLPLLDKRAVAHALSVSLATIDRLCREGRIPFKVVGDSRRFDLVAVLAALESVPVTASPALKKPTHSSGPSIAGVRLLSSPRRSSTGSSGNR